MLVCLVIGTGCDEDPSPASNQSTTTSDVVTTDCRKFLHSSPVNPNSTPATSYHANLSLTLNAIDPHLDLDKIKINHTRLFHETAWVGLSIYRGKICVENGKNCLDSCLDYRIEAGGILEQKNHSVTVKSNGEKVTMQYWYVDDGNNLGTVETSFIYNK